MNNQFGLPILGFVLADGECFQQESSEKGHIEVAFRILNSDNIMKARFERTQWAPNNPVDYLVFDEGAIKVGNRWGDKRILQYNPYLICRKTEEIIEEYRSLNYDIREIFLPQDMDVNFFHR